MTPALHGSGQIRFWLCVGLVIGMLGSVSLAWRWTATGAGTHVAVLGAGKSVSVLITNDHRRVLIASGNNGAAFANALGVALPPFVDSIDLVLVDTRASADLIDRVKALDAKRTMELPDPERGEATETILRSFQVDLGEDVILSVRVEASARWSAELRTSAGVLSISPSGVDHAPAPVRITLDGTTVVDPGGTPSVWIGPAANGLARTSRQATVGTGSVLPITMDGSAFRIPREFFGAVDSSQRTDHLPSLDRQAIVEFRPD
jgi:hypothetical protein